MLKSKVAIITGGASGIGFAGAKKMASEGATVVLADRDSEAAKSAASNLLQAGLKAIPITCDVSEEDSIKELVSKVVTDLGRIDILHSHAGVQIEGSIEEVDAPGFDLSHKINVRGHYLISKLVLKQMKIQSGGVILITASNAGVFPDYGMVGYITSKAAAVMLVEQLALDLAEYNIRVNCICPGWVDTPFNDPYTKQLGGRKELEKVVKNRVPLKRFGTAKEIADAILFLVSDQSSYITGHSLVIDGGEKLVGAGPK